MDLQRFFEENPRCAVAFSGGADSAYLLYSAKAYGAEIKAYYVKTRFQPEFELEDAKRLARKLNADMEIIEFDILGEEEIAKNTENRCYLCKKRIFEAISERAEKDGYKLILDGTNASDLAADRPGMMALAEIGVKSPLRLCGLTKTEVRAKSKAAGLFTWNKPAYACLATRIPSGEMITEQLLDKIEAAEDFLFGLGFTDFRVRVFNGAARLQLTSEQFERAVLLREKIYGGMRQYFDDVLLDLRTRQSDILL